MLKGRNALTQWSLWTGKVSYMIWQHIFRSKLLIKVISIYLIRFVSYLGCRKTYAYKQGIIWVNFVTSITIQCRSFPMDILKSVWNTDKHPFIEKLHKLNLSTKSFNSLYTYGNVLSWQSVWVRKYSEKKDVSSSVVKSDMIIDFLIQSLCFEGSLVT